MNHPSPLAGPSSVLDEHGLTRRLEQLARSSVPTLGTYLKILLSRKWLVLAITLAIVILTAVALSFATPIYRAVAVVLIENQKTNVISIEGVSGQSVGSREFYQTQTEFIRSREVGLRVVEKLGLIDNPLFDPRGQSPGRLQTWLSRWTLTRGLVPEVGSGDLSDADATEKVVSVFKAALSVAPVRQSQLIEIRFDSPDPELAARISNETADSYITADLDARFNQQQAASRWLNDRLEQLGETLEKSELVLQSYREEIGLIVTPTPSMGGNVRTLDAASERLLQARIDRAQIEAIYSQVAKGSSGRYDVPTVFNNPAVVSARANVAEAQRKASEAAQSLGTSHPQYRTARADLSMAQENLRIQSEGVISSIEKQFEVARNTERQLEAAIAQSRGTIRDINRKEGRLNALEREVTTNRQIYEIFLSKVKETDATADFRNSVGRVVDRAVPPLTPVKPAVGQIMALAMLGGFVIACLLAIAVDQSVSVIRSVDDVAEKLAMPLIAAVPKLDKQAVLKLPRLQHEEPRSPFAEANRSALTGVNLSLMHVRHPIVGVTSSVPNEGKSTVALSLAIEHARTRKTLLIDADLRNPSIHRMLGMTESRHGLSELIRGAAPESCLMVAPEFGLSFLLAGAPSKDAQDLLIGERFTDILAQMQARYEMIIIDTPPLELVADALPIGVRCNGMVYVMKSGETPIPIARRGIQRLIAANVNVLGILLNQHDFSKAGRYYGEQTAYGKYGKTGYGKDIAYPGNASA